MTHYPNKQFYNSKNIKHKESILDNSVYMNKDILIYIQGVIEMGKNIP